MNILLIGEYSRFHNSLKEGLQKLGHRVTLAGNGDGFKQYPVDINLDGKICKTNSVINFFRQGIFRVFKFDIAVLETLYRFKRNKHLLKDYDLVQLVNEFPFKTTRHFEKKLLQHIFDHNKKVFLSACGDDYVFISYLLNSNLDYTVFTPYHKDPSLKEKFGSSLAYIAPSHEKLHNFVFENVSAVIPGDLDYVMAYQDQPKATELIPFPINTDKIAFNELKIKEKIVIFHGVNNWNYYKKGNDLFDAAMDIIQKKHPHKVEIVRVENLPYSEYIKKYNAAHIILDQIYSRDQGYNALEAMAKGKVAFTGAEEIFENQYQLKEQVCINVVPDVDQIVAALEDLIQQPEKIVVIGKNARAFVETHHHYTTVAKQYLNIWQSTGE